MRSWLALGVVGFWSLAALVAACGGDDPASSSSGATPSDGGATSDGAPVGTNDGSTGSVEIVAADLTVYIGSSASIDASQTSATEFTWTVKTVPAGSGVTTAKLIAATTARPNFVPDVAGEYVLDVTARSGGVSGTKSVKVKAVAAPLFYMQTNFSEDPPYFEFRTVGTDKSNNHPIACRVNGESVDSGQSGSLTPLSFLIADMGLDWWEAPPGSTSRAAFTTFQYFADGGSNSFLALGSADTTCASPPAKINHVVEDGGDPTSFLVQPRYSPNGARVAFIDKRVAGYLVEAVSYDGNDRRAVANYCEPGVDSCWSPAVFPPRPQWFDNQTLGWARARTADAGSGWEVVLANDSANPNPRVHMTCDGVVPRSIAFLKDGSVIANRAAAGTNIEDLLVLRPATAGGPCQVVRNLTNLTVPYSYARDFAVSPDETEVVFVRSETPPKDGGSSLRFGGDLYTVPLNGTAAPTPFGGAPQYALFGGRYVASGSQIAWNGAVPLAPDSGVDASFVEAGAPVLRLGVRNGGQIQNLVESNLEAGIYVIGGGNGGSCDFRLDLCSVKAGPAASGGSAFAAAGAALVLAARRKRRRSR